MTARSLGRKAIERLVHRFGYEMRIVGAPPAGYAAFLQRITAGGVHPKTVFDIGVGTGTPWLYEAFPAAHFVLVEPQQEFEPAIKAICAKLDAEYHMVGAGSQDEYMPIYRLDSSPTGSSFLQPTSRTDEIWGASTKSAALHVVPLDTFDTLAAPFFVKIDTEGYELEVLRGAGKVLAKTDVVLMEVAITRRQVGEPDLVDIGAFMKNAGFRLIDFPMLAQQGRNGPLLYADVAFARTGVLE